MAKRISEAELLSALESEVAAYEVEAENAINATDEAALERITKEVTTWRANLAQVFSTPSRPVQSLSRRMASLASRLSLWLDQRPDPLDSQTGSRPLAEAPIHEETDQSPTAPPAPPSPTQDLNPPTPSDQTPSPEPSPTPPQAQQQPIPSPIPEPAPKSEMAEEAPKPTPSAPPPAPPTKRVVKV